MASRLIVASTRLPITLTRSDAGWQVTPSAGGLVTALSSVREQRKFTWLGWPGAFVDQHDRKEVTQRLAQAGASPVFIDEENMEGFYEGFSNDMLWPLFHNLTERSTFNRDHWISYRAVNQMYADAIQKVARPGDVIWVHDYQLCLVPQMLREKGLGCPVGFFLHIPFPPADVYRTLPVAEEILRGLLGADVIGFHAYEYVSHFRTAALRVLGIDSDTKYLPLQSRRVHLEVLPIGIDPGEVQAMLQTAQARKEQTDVERTYAGKRIVVGVDRLDYTKGIPQKLIAFEEMLQRHPEWRESVVLVQVAAPTRTAVEEYQQLKREVDELVGRINGKFSTPSHTPVVYVNQGVERARLMGLYRAAQIALVTPVRDGMNLVALEYVAARKGLGGTLILSEFCGAAHCLPGSKLVNPFNSSQVATVLAESLEDDAPHLESFAHMEKFIDENTSMRWSELFLEKLEKFSGDRSAAAQPLRVRNAPVRQMIERAKRPLVLLDYDGTLRSYVINPSEAVPSERILNVLRRLSTVCQVYVVSGRDGATLERWLGHLDIGLVCEHGLAIKLPDWQGRRNVSGSALTRLIKPLFDEFVQRTPGSTIEVKQAAIAWHWRAAEPEYSLFQSKELITRLEDLLKRRPYKVLRGNRVIEVRHEHVTKGSAVGHLLERHPKSDFVFCAGDDRTDEDMMRAIPAEFLKKTVRCWVGAPNANAEYWRESSAGLLGELELMAGFWERAAKAQRAGSQHVQKTASKRAAPEKPTRSGARHARVRSAEGGGERAKKPKKRHSEASTSNTGSQQSTPKAAQKAAQQTERSTKARKADEKAERKATRKTAKKAGNKAEHKFARKMEKKATKKAKLNARAGARSTEQADSRQTSDSTRRRTPPADASSPRAPRGSWKRAVRRPASVRPHLPNAKERITPSEG